MRDFSKTRRIVIKVGTNVLSKNSRVDVEYLGVIARQISELIGQGRQVILVTSGAIGMGMAALGIKGKVSSVVKRQACAAVGQGILMHEYEQAFGQFGQIVAQVLLTDTNMSNRKYYVNLKNAMEELLAMKVLPIINENDPVSIDEIDLAFGDNDRLSALVASKIDAELLMILTDVDGLYDKNPRQYKDAVRIGVVYEVTEEVEQMAGTAGSLVGTGGMKTKISAIKIAAQGGCKVILAHGREENVIVRAIAGETVGTLFLPKRTLSNRKRWLLNSREKGTLLVDPGAETALRQHRSLLLPGITGVEGDFKAGEVVRIGKVAKGVVTVSSKLLAAMLQEKPRGRTRAIVHVDNMVLLD